MVAPTGSRAGIESGQFATLADMVATQSITANSICHVFDLNDRGDYYITVADEGGGTLLDNGLYANHANGGGGVQQITAFEFNQTIASGVTGDILTLNAPAEMLIKLTALSCTASSNQGGISIINDGYTVIDQKVLSDETPATQTAFYISSGVGLNSVNSSNGSISDIIGASIVINKNAGNTTQNIIYSYQVIKMI